MVKHAQTIRRQQLSHGISQVWLLKYLQSKELLFLFCLVTCKLNVRMVVTSCIKIVEKLKLMYFTTPAREERARMNSMSKLLGNSLECERGSLDASKTDHGCICSKTTDFINDDKPELFLILTDSWRRSLS